MVVAAGPAMLATVGGTLALLLGLLLLLLPLLATELSRPRDSVWGAVVLLLGLVLVTSADRLTGAPMLAVLCGGLLIGRLSSEVGLGRWRQLTEDERQLLASSERWSRSAQQLSASIGDLLQRASALLSGLGGVIARRPKRIASSKRWVRPELPQAAPATEPPSPGEPAFPSSPPQAADSESQQSPGTTTPAADGEATAGTMADPGAQEPSPLPAATAKPAGAEAAPDPGSASPAQVREPDAADGADPASRVVNSFAEISALLANAHAPEAETSEAG